MRQRSTVLALALAVGSATAGVGYAIDSGVASGAADVLGPGEVTVEMKIDYSLFDTDELTVQRGTLLRFVLHNNDPINHEFIVGYEDVHQAHATGTHPTHPPVPGEVSLPAGETGSTVYRFDEPGEFRFVCHLPGHEAYGMEGVVTVR